MSSTPERRAGKRPAPVPPAPEVVDPVWLARAFAAVLLLALLCAYLTLCGLFYRGQWQLVLHPSRTFAPPATVGGVAFNFVRFGAGQTGIPERSGWWIPAAPGSAPAHLTLLFLPGGDGSLADNQATLAQLHDLGLSIFAIDYRGYGQSADLRPSEATMTEDAEQAWTYLTGSRALPATEIIPYGRGLGAALALHLAAANQAAPALILDSPDFTVDRRVREDPRSRLVPLRLLFHNHFALFPTLAELRTPKLILSRADADDPSARLAADPKLTVNLPPSSPPPLYLAALRRFLDAYTPASRSPSSSVPAPAP